MENNSNSLTIDVNGQKMYIEGITRYTICDDVIEMMFYNSQVQTESYAVFESTNGVERKLYGKESILKVVRSRGADKASYTLLIRKEDNKSKMTTFSQAKRKLPKMMSQNVIVGTTEIVNYTIQSNLNKAWHKQTVEKVIGNSYPKNDQEKYTKLGLLKRFLGDVMLHKKRQTKERSRSRVTLRTPGDGCSETLDSQRFRKDVENNTCNNTYNDSEYHTRHQSNLNAAFVDGDNTPDSDMMNGDTFTTYNDTIDFDTAVTPVDMLEDGSISSDNESAFEDESICELERNISEAFDVDYHDKDSSDLDSTNNVDQCFKSDNTFRKLERIIDIFRNKDVNGADHELEMEDDCMESFMNTVVYNSDSDEGMGSLASDTE